MPLSDIRSYVVVGQEFEAHWTDVDADRVANTLPVLSLPDGFSLAGFSADLAAVQASITGIEDLDNALGLAANDRNTSRKTVRDAIMNRDQVRRCWKRPLDSTTFGLGHAVRSASGTPQE
jgi:hypothetical protein